MGTGTGFGTGKLAGTEVLEGDRFARVVEGSEEPEGKTGLPGGRDKAKLIRKSQATGRRLLPRRGMGQAAGRRTRSLAGLGAVPMVWSRAEGELAGQRGSDGRAGVGQGKKTPGLGLGCSRACGKREFTECSNRNDRNWGREAEQKVRI